MPSDTERHPDLESRLEAVREQVELNPQHRELTPRRIELMLRVVSSRLSSVTLVMENLWDPHNCSAVVRSAEALGLDRVHVVEDPHPYRRHPSILHGADRWISIERHPDVESCLARLSEDGFLTCAADVGEGCVPLPELPAEQPIAIVMGTEKDGLSLRAKTLTDLRYTVPMFGFTESFNVSVGAALSLHDLTTRRRRHLECSGDLSVEEMVERVNGWLRATRKRRRS